MALLGVDGGRDHHFAVVVGTVLGHGAEALLVEVATPPPLAGGGGVVGWRVGAGARVGAARSPVLVLGRGRARGGVDAAVHAGAALPEAVGVVGVVARQTALVEAAGSLWVVAFVVAFWRASVP